MIAHCTLDPEIQPYVTLFRIHPDFKDKGGGLFRDMRCHLAFKVRFGVMGFLFKLGLDTWSVFFCVEGGGWEVPFNLSSKTPPCPPVKSPCCGLFRLILSVQP